MDEWVCAFNGQTDVWMVGGVIYLEHGLIKAVLTTCCLSSDNTGVVLTVKISCHDTVSAFDCVFLLILSFSCSFFNRLCLLWLLVFFETNLLKMPLTISLRPSS